MCLIGIRIGPNGTLLIAANRDEFADRPTRPLHWWPEGFLAGKDLRAGGTWIGISKDGRFAAVTNVRDASIRDHPVPMGSRGLMVSAFLKSESSPRDYVQTIAEGLALPSPFNLIAGKINDGHIDCWWLGGRPRTLGELSQGSYTLSNAELDTAWPKAVRLKERLLDGDDNAIETFMQSTECAADHELPDTGVSPEWERRLSAVRITGPDYHTRSTTLMSSRDRRVEVREKVWTTDGRLNAETTESFVIGSV